MNTKFLLGCLTFTALASTSFATLIPIGAIPSTGNGLGAVNTVLTFQNTGTESGCVGYIGGTTVTGPSACNTAVTGSVGGNEQTGSGNNVYTPASLGISSSGSTTFANLVLIFNGSEPQGGSGSNINLTNLSLNLFGSSSVAYFTAPSASYTAFPGTGSAGFAYQLDTAQAAAANAFFAANPDLRIGASATATDAAGGLETIQVATLPGIPSGGGGGGTGAAPEPATYLYLTGGFLGLGLYRRKSFRTR